MPARNSSGISLNLVSIWISLRLWESAFFADFHNRHQGQPPLKKLFPFVFEFVVIAVGAVGTVGKPSVFFGEAFPSYSESPIMPS